MSLIIPSRRALLSSAGLFPLAAGRNPLLFANFVSNQYLFSGSILSGAYGDTTPFLAWLVRTGGSFARSSTKLALGADGLFKTIASGAPAFGYDAITLLPNGLFVEGARTNVALWSRDLTNAAWTKSNVTAAKDQVGLDGAANAASSLVATADGGTVTQAITLASSLRFQSAYFKRLAGSSPISMSTDGGTTFTQVNVISTWTRQAIPGQTLANPSIVIKFTTSGDSIAVDYVQNENGDCASSPIATTTVAVTRAADIAELGISWVSSTGGTWFSSVAPKADIENPVTAKIFNAINSNGLYRAADVFISPQMTVGVNVWDNGLVVNSQDTGSYIPSYSGAVAFSATAGAASLSVNGSAGIVTTPASIPSVTNLAGTALGRYRPDNSGPYFGCIQKFGYWNVAAAGDVQRLSTVPNFNPDRSKYLVTWGDSLAASAGASGPSTFWLTILAAALKRPYSNQGVGGTTSTDAKNKQTADTAHQNWLAIYWTGHNNLAPASTVVSDIQAMIAHQTTTGGKYLVILPVRNTANGPGVAGDNTYLLRSALQAAFPSNYVDVPAALLANGNGSAGDNAAIAVNQTPPSLQADSIHLNDAGYAIAAATVQAALVSNGW